MRTVAASFMAVGLLIPVPTFAACPGTMATYCPAGFCQRCWIHPTGRCVCTDCGRIVGCGGYSGPPTPNYGQAEKPKGKYWKFQHETNPRY